jgi:DNA repair exonuclease SbcCD ATPase subunit
MENLRGHARRTREAMRQARFTPQLTAAMNELFAVAGQSLDASEKDIVEIAIMMRAMHEKFGKAYGITIEPPPGFTLQKRHRDLEELESRFRRQFSGLLNLLTLDKRTLTQQFFETVVLQIRKIFDHANRDTDYWLRAQMSPLENQVREVQRQLKHRLESVRRIHEAAESLEDRIEEVDNAKALLDARLNELEELEVGLLAALRPPRQAPLRAAA